MSPDAMASIVAAVATGGFAAWGARSARRTKRDHRRDDFTAVTEQQGKAITRLEQRVERGEAEVEKQRDRISDLEEANNWLLGRLRDLASLIRKGGQELPAQRPMSEKAARVLPQHIDV